MCLLTSNNDVVGGRGRARKGENVTGEGKDGWMNRAKEKAGEVVEKVMDTDDKTQLSHLYHQLYTHPHTHTHTHTPTHTHTHTPPLSN